MRENYQECYRLVREHEGGYVNHPKDPGGATKWGVIQRNYDAYRRRKGKRRQSVKNLTEIEAAEIYKSQYWDKVQGDDLPAGVDYAVFDFAIHSGPGRAAQYLQRIVKTQVDGQIGDVTLSKLREHPPAKVVKQLCDDRMAFLRRLRHFKSFGRGWTRRVMGRRMGFQKDDIGVIDVGIMMAQGAATTSVRHREAPGPARGPKSLIGVIVDLIAALFGGGDPVKERK